METSTMVVSSTARSLRLSSSLPKPTLPRMLARPMVLRTSPACRAVSPNSTARSKAKVPTKPRLRLIRKWEVRSRAMVGRRRTWLMASVLAVPLSCCLELS